MKNVFSPDRTGYGKLPAFPLSLISPTRGEKLAPYNTLISSVAIRLKTSDLVFKI
jgi:hypothetical protein